MIMSDRYSSFRQILKQWQDNEQSFDRVESFFFAEIFVDQTADRLSVLVEMHRLIKLIKADLALLQVSRSESNRHKYKQQIQARSEKLREFCQGES